MPGFAAGAKRNWRQGAGGGRRERDRPFKEGRDRRRGEGRRFDPESASWLTDLGLNRSHGLEWECDGEWGSRRFETDRRRRKG